MLAAGVIICLINTFFTVMGSAFGVDIFPGFRGFCTAAFIYIALLMLPAFLVMFRWSRIGTVATWSVTICCFSPIVGWEATILCAYSYFSFARFDHVQCNGFER